LVRIYPVGASSVTGDPSGVAPSSQVAPLPPARNTAWYAELYMQGGQLQYGAVFTSAGERRLVGDQALQFLGSIGGLSYELLPLPARPALPPPTVTGPLPHLPSGYLDRSSTPVPPSYHPSSEGPPRSPPAGATSFAAWRPVRTRWGEHILQNAQQLSREQRRVLSLINGQRPVDELSRLLGCSPEALRELLIYFRNQNFIS
jgi:hypothetical protein